MPWSQYLITYTGMRGFFEMTMSAVDRHLVMMMMMMM
jgi:hypothetical protein